MVVMAPGDEHDLEAMLPWALEHGGPVAMRYPKATVERHEGSRTPIELGKAEVLAEGSDGLIIACGTLLGAALEAATLLGREGLEVAVINARFIKPLDTELLLGRIDAAPWVVTVEENALPTGFGSAVLEAINDAHGSAGLPSVPLVRLGLPDRFVEHGERGELLAEVGLDAAGIAATCRRLAGRSPAAVAAAAPLSAHAAHTARP
jgi:1-deoxy-D-xylulose-5-phosphate synthase